MIWALIALSVVTAAALVAAGWRHESARSAVATSARRLREAERRADEASRRSEEAVRAARQAQERAGSAETGAQVAADRALQAEARLAVTRRQLSAAQLSLESLWELAVLEGERAWRLAMGSPRPQASRGARPTLGAAVDAEVQRIREETGTPGAARTALAGEPAPVDAIVALRAVQALLAVLTRYSQGYDLELRGGGGDGKLVATLVCEGFEGPDAVADETSSVLGALTPAGGDLDIDSLPDGRLRATLSVPTGRLARDL